MTRKSWLLAACCLGASAAPASAQPETPVATPAQSSYTIERRIVVGPDLLAEKTMVRRWKLLERGGSSLVGQQSVSYVESMEDMTVKAYTEKADGIRVPVQDSNIITRDISSGTAAMYMPDAKQKVVIFPGLDVGDTAVLETRSVRKLNTYDGYFMASEVFPIWTGASGTTRLTIDIAKGVPVRIEVSGEGVESDVTNEDNAGTHRTVTVRRDAHTRFERGEISPFDWSARVVASNFNDYTELGQAYGKRAWPKAAVTPEIAELADKITAGINDKRKQAIAIDAWVKQNIRYVALFRELARVIPNEAAAILKNRYGDCKDHVTLLAALLAAKGIDSEQVLINLGTSYQLPKQPVHGMFNHVILYLPAFDLYDDPTATYNAFGVLSASASDKPVVRMDKDGKVTLGHTPALKADDNVTTRKADIRIAADGKVSGRVEEISTGLFASLARSEVAAMGQVGFDHAVVNYLNNAGMPGTGAYQPEKETGLADPYVVRSNFQISEPWQVPLRGPRKLSYGPSLFGASVAGFFGTRELKRVRDFVCRAGKRINEIDITFAPGLKLPPKYKPVEMKTKLFSLKATYVLTGRTLKVRQTFIATPAGQVCAAGSEKELAEAVKKAPSQSGAVLTFR